MRHKISLTEFNETSCKCVGDDLPDTLYMDVSDRAAEHQDWAAVAMLYPAMLKGHDLHINGAVSDTLLWYLGNDVQAILKRHNPALQGIEITAKKTHRKHADTGHVATGFSAGVDSFTTLHEFPEVTHLTVFNVGSMGPDCAELFASYVKRAKDYADQKGLKFIKVDSNLDAFFAAASDGRVSFQKTHTIRNAAAALALDVNDYLYSSGVDYGAVNISEKNDTAYMDPVLLPMLGTRSMRLHSAGTSFSRSEKTQIVAKMLDAATMLDVCVADPLERVKADKPNCSTCWKCSRTLVTLEAAGQLEKFGSVFDLNLYRTQRNQLITDLMMRQRNGDTVAGEAVDFAKHKGLDMPSDNSVTIKHILTKLRIKQRLELG